MRWLDRVDVDAWVRDRLGVHNDGGGRGYDAGVRTIACPFHPEETGPSAWVNVQTGWVRCFNPNCLAHTGLNAVEAARRLEGFRTWTEALVWLKGAYPRVLPLMPAAPPLPAYTDWCELPPSTPFCRNLGAAPGRPVSPLADEAAAFLRRQWGVAVPTAERFGLRYCTRGRHAWRIILPIVMGGQVVAFQSRSYRGGEPKYRTSQHGARGKAGAECGRPAEALLFNLDAVTEGSDVTLVEGPGDVLRWSGNVQGRVHAAGDRDGCNLRDRQATGLAVRDGDSSDRVYSADSVPIAVALLGTTLTEEKAALLAAKAPGTVTVALDADVGGKSALVAERLAAWGLAVQVGAWVGGKDAGAGAQLVVGGGGSFRERLAQRLGGQR